MYNTCVSHLIQMTFLVCTLFRRSSLASTALEEQIDNVEPLADTEENQLMIEVSHIKSCVMTMI